MKRLLWLVLLGTIAGTTLTVAAQQTDSGLAPTASQAIKKHKRHRHHKNPHKGHIDHDQYPSAGLS